MKQEEAIQEEELQREAAEAEAAQEEPEVEAAQETEEEAAEDCLVCYFHHTVTNNGFLIGVPFLKFLRHNILPKLFILYVHHRIVKVGIKFLTCRLNGRYAQVGQYGHQLLGEPAKRQAVTNSEKTISSIKRDMGTDHRVTIDDKKYSPQEISAMILGQNHRRPDGCRRLWPVPR